MQASGLSSKVAKRSQRLQSAGEWLAAQVAKCRRRLQSAGDLVGSLPRHGLAQIALFSRNPVQDFLVWRSFCCSLVRQPFGLVTATTWSGPDDALLRESSPVFPVWCPICLSLVRHPFGLVTTVTWSGPDDSLLKEPSPAFPGLVLILLQSGQAAFWSGHHHDMVWSR